jgi:two-component system, cell cycle response regulator DivK
MANILVVEDSHDNREITEMILRSAGHNVMSAADGASGIAAAGAHPDLILMDLALPRVDGWEATRRLKANPATRDIPIIAFTAHLMKDDIERAKDAGCVAVIGKPFEIDTLLQQIDLYLDADHGSQDGNWNQARSLGR